MGSPFTTAPTGKVFHNLSRRATEVSAPARSRSAIIEAMKIDVSDEEVKLWWEALERYYAGREYSSFWFGIVSSSVALRSSASSERPINTCQTSMPVRKNERSGVEKVTTPNSALSLMFSSTTLPGVNLSGR
jgi:hypothetical protein